MIGRHGAPQSLVDTKRNLMLNKKRQGNPLFFYIWELQMRILMIEDEPAISEAVAEVLIRNNYLIDITDNGESGRYHSLDSVYAVIILDLMLPKIDGLTILNEIRAENISTAVICLTAKSQLEDKILGLDKGADDYITKPFHIEELLARIRAIERRSKNIQISGTIKYGDLELNPHKFELICFEKIAYLTPKESQILEFMMQQDQLPLSKNLLIQKIWSYDSEVTDNQVEIQISLLRKKIASLQSQIKIKTIRGSGYHLTGKEL